MKLNEERARLNVLLERKFLSGAEMEELKENQFVVEAEYVGKSDNFYGYYWYDVKVCQEASLPDDDDCLTTNYDIYEKIEDEE